ncbi:hypothetical protein PMI33_02439 [Pseudomonas sp. GM67]|nr:hypothetical protein PMI33_02439 [Pseudomonas sp. GM67]
MVLPIELVARQPTPFWVVHAYGMNIRFSDQKSAEKYATKLEERVCAPHALPLEIQKQWTVEHFRMVRGA